LLAFVPSLGTREVLAFGEGVALPTRLKFKQLPENLIPQSQAVINSSTDPAAALNEDFIDTIVDRWRGATMSTKQGLDGDFVARDESWVLPASLSSSAAAAPLAPQAPTVPPKLDPDRFRLLKKPLDSGGTFGQGAPVTPRWPR